MYRFDEGQGDKLTDSSGNGHDGKIVGAKWVTADGTPMASSYALQFDGKTSAVSIPTLKRETDGPLTIETWARPDLNTGIKVVFLLGGKQQWQFNQDWKRWAALDSRCASMFTTVVPNQFAHLAYVADEKEGRFYVDGKLQERTPIGVATMKNRPRPHAWMGATETSGRELQAHFAGLIGPTRVSSAARYDKEFIPQRTFAADQDTLALYKFEEGQGDMLKDSSGNGHHGKIFGAKWVNADGTTIANESYTLKLDNTSRVRMPSLTVDLSQPVTVEGWVAPVQRSKAQGYSILCDGAAGIGARDTWHAHFYGIDPQSKVGKYKELTSKVPVVPGQSVHVALVSTGRQIRFYVDGRLAVERNTDDLTPAKAIFGLGKNDENGLNGLIREVRVSSTVRYDKVFTPQLRFTPDADTLALYHCDEGEGDVLKDSSGNGHDGKIVGAKWVKIGEASPRASEKVGPIPAAGSPFDALKRENIAIDSLTAAGGGNADKAPKELVAVFGTPRKVTNRSLAISLDGSRIFAGFAPDESMQAWDVATGQMLPEWTKESYTTGGLSLSHDGRRLVRVAPKVHTYIVADALTGKDLFTLGEHTKAATFDATRGIALSPDGSHLATCNGQGKVIVWEVATGKKRFDLDLPPCTAMYLTYSNDGKWLVAHSIDRDMSDDDNHVLVWNADDGKEVLRKAAGSAYLSKNLAISPDNSWLVVNGPKDSKTMEMWELPSGKLKGTVAMKGRPQDVSPDGKHFVALGGTGLLLIDAATGAKVEEWKSHASPYRAAFAPDGRHIVLANNDGTIHVLRLSTLAPAGN